jgi:hypothetical protein
VVGGHQQGVFVLQGERDVGLGGGVHHLLGVAAFDPAVPVIVGQHRHIAVAQAQASGPLPFGAEPDRLGELDVAEHAGQQGHTAAVLDRLQLPGVPGEDHLGAAGRGVADRVGQVRAGDH